MVSFTRHSKFEISLIFWHVLIVHSFLLLRNIFICMNLSSFIDPFFCSWSFQLYPVFDYYKVAMNVHIQVGICTNFSCTTMENHSITWSEVAGTQGSRHTQLCCQFSKVVEQIYTSTSNKWPFSCSTSSLSIDTVSLFAVNQSVLSHCDFNLHFLDE